MPGRIRNWLTVLFLPFLVTLIGCNGSETSDLSEASDSVKACLRLVAGGLRDVPDDRADRFVGKVQIDTARCRGGADSVAYQELDMPWVDWSSYWGAAGPESRNERYDGTRFVGRLLDKAHASPNMRGIDGALIDLEYERVELIKFNLFEDLCHLWSLGRSDEFATKSLHDYCHLHV